MKSENISKFLINNILYICLLIMIVIIAVISPSFLSARVLSDVLIQSAPKILLAMGMLVVIIAGGMDMTVGRLAGLGAVIAGTVFKLFHIEDPVAQGLAMGTASHAIGTSKALEMGEIQAAMSSLAIAVTGIFTVIIGPIIAGLY